MAFDEVLADRIRKALGRRKGIEEKKMFGGIAFLLHGNMCVGVHKESLIVRIDPEQSDETLAEANVSAFAVGGRTMKGWVLVAPEGIHEDGELKHWIDRALAFVVTLPPK